MGEPGRMRAERMRLGELDCVVADALPLGDRPDLLVVLGHGFGASGEDLVGLAPALASLAPALAARARFVFPAAPLTLEEVGMPDGRAWYRLPPDVLMGRMRDWDRFARETPEGLLPARRALTSVLDALVERTGLPYGRMVLGGFSQGAMVSTDVALHLDAPPAGLVLLSGSLMSQDAWQLRAEGRPGLPVFQSHGRHDDVLVFSQAERLRDLLESAGARVEFHPFDGPHTIPSETVDALAEFLTRRLG